MKRTFVRSSRKPQFVDPMDDLRERSKIIARKTDIITSLVRQNQADMRLNQFDEKRLIYINEQSEKLGQEQREMDIEIAIVKEESQILNGYRQEVVEFQKKVKNLFLNLEYTEELIHQKLECINKSRKKWMKRIRNLEQIGFELTNREHEIKYLIKEREAMVNTVKTLNYHLIEFLQALENSLDHFSMVTETLAKLKAAEELNDF